MRELKTKFDTMKKIKPCLWRVVMYAVVVFSAGVQSCNDDESTKLQFTFDGSGEEVSFSLEGANIYLTENGENNDALNYNFYAISDGTYKNGDGSSLSHYDNATYCFMINLAYSKTTGMTSGEFPTRDMSDLTSTGNGSYIRIRKENDQTNLSSDDGDDSPVIVTGGVNNGEKMTLKFKGALTYLHDCNESGECIRENGTGEFHFTGIVQDVR